VHAGKIQDAAIAAVRAAAPASRDDEASSPFPKPDAPWRRNKATAAASPETPTAVAQDAPEMKRRSAEDQEWADKIADVLQRTLGEHPTYQRDDAERIMVPIIYDLIDRAGDGHTCLVALTWALSDAKRVAMVMSADKLGGYLRKCFPGWLGEYRSREGVPRLPEQCQTVEDVANWVKFLWPEHPSCQTEESWADLLEPLEDCVEMVQTPRLTAILINSIHHYEKETVAAVAKSANLGGYIKSCFPGWLDKYGEGMIAFGYVPEDEGADDDAHEEDASGRGRMPGLPVAGRIFSQKS
jgi:hypothetical protein